jgi:DNA-binding transcriptional ArsR family regulator
MKRDMELIRKLLLKLESHPSERGDVFSIVPPDDAVAVYGYTDDEIAYHLDLLSEAGLIDSPGSQPMGGVTFARLSWAGHDFLDSVREEETWTKTKSGLRAIGGYSFDIVKDLATGYIKAKAAEKLGISL